MQLNTSLCEHLSELVVVCDASCTIRYANPAAQRWSPAPLAGEPFTHLLSPESAPKAQNFLEAAGAGTADAPSAAWELPLGDALHYTVASFRGYRDGDELVIIGQIEPAQVGEMQRELLALTSELSEAQREQRRQNRQLQAALDEQRQLLETISDLTSPAVPIWDRVLLLSLVGHLDSRRAEQLATQLLERVARHQALFTILDVSGISIVDTAVAQQLIGTAQALRLLGVQPILVGINPEIAQTIVGLGVQLTGFVVHGDLHSALAFVLRRLGQLARP